jgi:sugar (pentulose or hexulose) kinase
MSEQVLCVDLGSTFTKAALVDAATGALLGSATHPTTLATDVLAASTRALPAAGRPRRRPPLV